MASRSTELDIVFGRVGIKPGAALLFHGEIKTESEAAADHGRPCPACRNQTENIGEDGDGLQVGDQQAQALRFDCQAGCGGWGGDGQRVFHFHESRARSVRPVPA